MPRLHLIGPLAVPEPGDYVRIAHEAAAGGVDAVHIRYPGKPGGDVLNLAVAVRERLEGQPVRLIVNDRIDVAMLIDADGVQLGERGIGVSDARRLVGTDKLIGRSVHDVDGAVRAEQNGATYLLAGHVFETGSKAGQPGRGLDWLRDIVAAVTIQVIAIGGITLERIGPVLDTGAHGVAMGREILRSNDVQAVAGEAAQIIDTFGGGQ